MYKHTQNVAGKYYVVCNWRVDHGICEFTAPNNFKVADEFCSAYVYKQPDTPEEEAQCKEAMNTCPMAAIRDNGETESALPLCPDQYESEL
jgi:ferredoxin